LDPFIQKHNYTFPIFPDLQREVFSLFAEQSIPRNVVLDRNGKIIYQSIGFEDKEFSKMVQLIKNELEKK
jgi:thioredoxin-related protein